MIPLLKEFLLPPGVFLLAGLIGIWNIQRNPRRAKRILIAVTILFYIFSTKIMASLLVGNLPVPPPLPPQSLDLMDSSDPPQAIVVLGAGLYEAAPEYGGDTVSGGSLARIRYGANLHRRSGLPLLVSGGRPENTKLSEAETMKAALETDFHVPVAWTEDISNTTWEGAQNVHEILAAEGINKIYLVTHANHMIRAEK
ncbi:MAG: YdcF family protein, partial [Rhodospirillaceae bacterium]|nr:YdcF family protein [Rhodospirillaceae bacterium]